eukprot:jgi/Psemu1/326076/estExt_fgenesh1_pg.C_3250001
MRWKIAIAGATTASIALPAVAVVQPVPTLAAGPGSQEQKEQEHRHLLKAETECILYLRMEGYEYRNHEQEHEQPNEQPNEPASTWTCRFEFDEEEEREGDYFGLGDQDTMEIEGLSEEFLRSNNVISGKTCLIMKGGGAKGAYLKKSFHRNSNSNTTTTTNTNNNNNTAVAFTDGNLVSTLVVPDEKFVTVRAISDKDKKWPPTKGTLKTLVVRIIDSTNSTPASAEQLRDDIFSDSYNMKTQFAACSKDQLLIEEAGIVDVRIDLNASNTSMDKIETKARRAARKLYGDGNDLWRKYDLVMFVHPTNSVLSNRAYAYIYGFDSYFANMVGRLPAYQLHEIGHNLGLGHSSQGGLEYGDRASYMGGIIGNDDGPHVCFNAANNYQLGWYDLQEDQINPLSLKKPKTVVLTGIDDYGTTTGGSSNNKTSNSSNKNNKKKEKKKKELVVLRLAMGKDTNGGDIYLGYDRAIGANAGVGEMKSQSNDTVMVIEKEWGGKGSWSRTDRVMDLQPGQRFVIETNKKPVFVDFQSVSSDKKSATVIITNNNKKKKKKSKKSKKL